MDRLIDYMMCVDVPYNEETTKGYFHDRYLTLASIENALNSIGVVIRKDGCISFGKIMRMLGMREQPEQPSIFFDDMLVDNTNIEETENGFLIHLFLIGGYTVLPPRKKKPKLRVVKKKEPDGDIQHTDKYFEISEKLASPKVARIRTEESEAADECQTGPKETSDSGENGKT